jgi:hypothetical protein
MRTRTWTRCNGLSRSESIWANTNGHTPAVSNVCPGASQIRLDPAPIVLSAVIPLVASGPGLVTAWRLGAQWNHARCPSWRSDFPKNGDTAGGGIAHLMHAN